MASAGEDWKQATLKAHNERRQLHGAPPLEWSDECYEEAKKQAAECQAAGSLFHGNFEGPSGRHGQNVYWSSNGGTADDAVQDWYNEMVDPGYDFLAGGFQPCAGHFTQVIWKETSSVGMVKSEDGTFIVANYFPTGNMTSSFEGNVVPPTSGVPPPAAKPASAPAQETSPDAKKAAKPPGDAGSTTVSANSMTPELEAVFGACPFAEFKSEAEQAFAAGDATVTVACERSGKSTEMTVTITQGLNTNTLTGSWE